MPEPKPFVFILGMHRSGTSCLAGCLERCGLHLGKVRRTGRFNAKGYFERQDAIEIHDQILAMNRASWHQPPAELKVHPYYREKLTAIARELAQRRPCGIKDPRLLLLLETWLEIAPPPHALVGTFRHPLAVAQSLKRRNGMEEKKAIALWLHYNRALIYWHQKQPFPLIEFDLSKGTSYRRAIALLAKQLGLSANPFRLYMFVSSKLEHHASMQMAMPSACEDIYRYLQARSIQNIATINNRLAKKLWLC